MKKFLEFIQESIVVAQGNLGIARKDMPQIKRVDIPHFLMRLQQRRIRVAKVTISVNRLRPTQKELNSDRIKEKLANQSNIKPFIISKDRYLLDGHHQWMALRMSDPYQIVVAYQVNLPMRELLGFARAYERSSYKNINGDIE